MSKTTAKRLNQVANGLERFAQGIVGGIELVVNDLTSKKRPRRRAVRKTTKQTHRRSRQQVPVVIIKIVKEEQ